MAAPEEKHCAMPHKVAQFLSFLVGAKQEVVEFYLMSFFYFCFYEGYMAPHCSGKLLHVRGAG